MALLLVNDLQAGVWAARMSARLSENLVKCVPLTPRDDGALVIPTYENAWNTSPLSDEELGGLLKETQVIFLDHNIPVYTGEKLLVSWREKFDLSEKRIVGISGGGYQRYAEYQYDPNDIFDYNKVGNFLREKLDLVF